ncbi:protein LDOC1-like [Rhineura floridana]|uniref:protein LDOC1-like n=1 Tax=Rhineura floridana TaxID=261503 RepID=UPI002AC86C39|nr:protein LDOC1-like [Rhineura floridana]
MTKNMEASGRAEGGIPVTLETLYAELQNLQAMTQNLQLENKNLRALIAQGGTAPAAAAPTRIKPPVRMPSHYGGQSDQFTMFHSQYKLYMSVRQAEFPTDDSKVAFLISLLEGEAAKWPTLYLIRKDPVLGQYPAFIAAMEEMF